VRAPILGTTPSSASESWFTRVRDNLRQVLTSTRLFPSSANGAPIHLLKLDRSGKAGQAQTASLLTHAGIAAAIAFFAVHSGAKTPPSPPLIDIDRGRVIFTPLSEEATSKPSLGYRGGGGENNPVPATRALLPPRSPIQLAPPRLPDDVNHLLPVPPTILDPQASPIITPVNELGLPWMPKDTGSAGPGQDHGIGSGRKGGMGDSAGLDAGDGDGSSPYARGVSMPVCSVCPYPVYTDEARHVKMQGTVTLRVLVDADGRASEIRVVTGVGYGLEERAVQTVREWKFKPARDAARRAVPAWVTIEVVFRLF
jgi:periplasmic protein TonB